MDTSLVMDIALDSLKVTILVAAPILAAALISGPTGRYYSGGDLNSGNDPQLYSKAGGDGAFVGGVR
jgi:hypothetical protein